MIKPVDDATQQFLDAAAADLQRQLQLAGTVEDLVVEPSGLTRVGPEPMLVSAYRHLLDT